MISSLWSVVFLLLVVGFLLYLFNLFVPLDGRFKNAINAIVCFIAFLYILQTMGWLPHGVRLK